MAELGLFADPQQLREAMLMQQAKMTPQETINYMALKGGQGLGEAIGGMFGVNVQDPAVARAIKLRELGAKYGTTTAEALDKIAADLQQTDPQMSMLVAAEANKIRKTAAEIDLKKTETATKLAEKLTPEQKNAAGLADSKYTRGTAEWTQAYQEALTSLTAKEGTKPTVVGVADGTRQPVYSDGTQQFIYAAGPGGTAIKQPYFGGVDRSTANVKVSATAESKGRAAFTEKLGALDAQRVEAASQARDSALATLRSLDSLSTLDDQGLISGSFATGRLGATNLLATLGLVGENDKQRLASSENYQKIAGDVILGTLGGKLGAGFSNDDRKFIQGLVPQLENSPAARRQLINFMARKNQQIINEANRLENYARDNEGLKGYQYNIPFSSAGAKASTMSVDDLAKAAGGRIVNGKFVKD
jgi:hypothetical protein